jgi:hypothetical protein
MRAYLRDLERKRQAPAVVEKPAVRSRYKWVVIAPDLFPGEEILGVMDPKYLEEAQKENPGLVTYLLPETEFLHPIRNEPDILKKIHLMKKEFGGFVTSWTPSNAVKDLKPL